MSEGTTPRSPWDERYGQEPYAYGEAPNVYLKEQLAKLAPGTILFPADGKGRNGVHAATQGWTVHSFDLSTEGRKKALKLAGQYGVEIDYRVGELSTLGYRPHQFDAVGLIYAHFPPALRQGLHRQINALLKPGGTVILEAFSKNHLPYRAQNPAVGGPPDLDTLFSLEEVQRDFPGFEVEELVEKEVELHEGLYHNGTGLVVRFTGRKQ